jgi:hypothetical protein
LILSTGCGNVCGFDENEIYQLFRKAIIKDIVFDPNDEIIYFYNRENQVRTFPEILTYCGI